MTKTATINKNTLYIFRGLPGSGKTTEANKLGCLVLSPADMYSMVGGEYKFHDRIGSDPAKRQAAFRWALGVADDALMRGMDVAIASVLPKRKSLKPWIALSEKHGTGLVIRDMIIDVETSIARNVHAVPEEVVRSMHEQFVPWSEE